MLVSQNQTESKTDRASKKTCKIAVEEICSGQMHRIPPLKQDRLYLLV